MAKRTIVKIGDDILRKTAKEVTEFDKKLHTLLDDMAETMNHANGAGLAAPQVGILKRVALVDTDGILYELINPQIIESEGSVVDVEGCLSIPNENAKVERPQKIKVKYFDRNGGEIIQIIEGYTARAFCHEIDHLNGILYIDKAIKNDEE